ncbi:LPS export ABC transporter permease LptF [Endozoicomonas sp. Mp262]|uniref:LPS export ABC transporter permease LptF n=1 Tax=Endozoicomonas sp. Mp262 TaxID=2919499 RepID=UPI0021DAD276
MPFIIFKYLTKQILQVLFAVSSVVLLILMSGRFVSYLAQAASGTLKADFILAIMGYRMPEFLVMIIPLGLFLGIILAYGRLYVESEMSVLSACGLSQNQLLGLTMIPAVVVMILVGLLSLYIAPMGIQKVETILATQDGLTEFDTMVPGRFQSIDGGSRATYSESLSDDRQKMEKVFIAHRNTRSENTAGITLVLADHARLAKREEGQSRYLILEDGYRYDLTPGQPEVRAINYKSYGIQMPENDVKEEITKEQAMPTRKLMENGGADHMAELQWRISLPLLVPIIVLLAIPLAQVNPRQGRFAKLLPGILMYLFYIMLLISCRGAINDGRLPPELGMWWVHALYLAIALGFYCYRPLKLRVAHRRSARAQA